MWLFDVLSMAIISRFSLLFSFVGFPASGTIQLEHIQQQQQPTMDPIQYTYNVTADNKNDRTIQTLSTKASSKMKLCNTCDYFLYYQNFYQYYGKTDYADRLIQAAATSTKIVFDSSEADFTSMSPQGRAGKYITSVLTRIYV